MSATIDATDVPDIKLCTRPPQSFAEWLAIPPSDDGFLRIRDDLEKRGATYRFPSGIARLNSPHVIESMAAKLVGAGCGSSGWPWPQGEFGTIFSFRAQSGDGLEMRGDDASVEGIGFWPVYYNPDHVALKFKPGATRATRANVGEVTFKYCGKSIVAESTVHFESEEIYSFAAWGQAHVQFRGAPGAPFEGATLNSLKTYNPWPSGKDPETKDGQGNIIAAEAWEPRYYPHGFTLIHAGMIWTCTQPGDSGLVPPSTPSWIYATDPHAITMVDGDARWGLVCRADCTGLWVDRHAYHVNAYSPRLLNSAHGLRLSGSGAAGSEPKHTKMFGLESDHCVKSCVLLEDGEDAYFEKPTLQSAALGCGMEATAGFKGDLTLIAPKLSSNGKHGFFQAAGPKNTLIVGPRGGGNSRLAPNTYDDYHFAPGATDFHVAAFTPCLETIAGTPRHNVFVGAGADRFIVQGGIPGIAGSAPFQNDAGFGIWRLFAPNLPFTGELLRGPNGHFRVDATFDAEGNVNVIIHNSKNVTAQDPNAWRQISLRLCPDGRLRVRNDSPGFAAYVLELGGTLPASDETILSVLMNLGAGPVLKKLLLGAAANGRRPIEVAV